jgi:hypothetical protein
MLYKIQHYYNSELQYSLLIEKIESESKIKYRIVHVFYKNKLYRNYEKGSMYLDEFYGDMLEVFNDGNYQTEKIGELEDFPEYWV